MAGKGKDLPEVTWRHSQAGNPGLPTVGQPGVGGNYTGQSLPKTQQASGCGGCSPLAPNPAERFLLVPQARHPRAGGKDKGWGRWQEQCSPGDVYKQPRQALRAARRCTCAMQMSAPCAALPEHLCHFPLGQCHQDRKTDAGGDQVQKGRL